jgi:hypothetical protein
LPVGAAWRLAATSVRSAPATEQLKTVCNGDTVDDGTDIKVFAEYGSGQPSAASHAQRAPAYQVERGCRRAGANGCA